MAVPLGSAMLLVIFYVVPSNNSKTLFFEKHIHMNRSRKKFYSRHVLQKVQHNRTWQALNGFPSSHGHCQLLHDPCDKTKISIHKQNNI